MSQNVEKEEVVMPNTCYSFDERKQENESNEM
jgi:hypothetical protein